MTGNDSALLGMLDSVLRAVTVGLIVLDEDSGIVLWNGWMERHTGLVAGDVIGKSLFAIFPDLTGKRMDSAVRQALRDKLPAILSQTLHKAPFALFSSQATRELNERMQQAITVTPLNAGDARLCLIQITDVSVAVARERLLRDQALELRSQTFSDGLTGIANRRHFDVAMEKEVRRANRARTALSLLMIDIDSFKPYNDHYGHQLGDEALVKVAGALADMVKRPSDLIARYGGEEFAVILPEMNEQQSLKMAEAMRAAVATLAIAHAKSAHAGHVTISIGLATYPAGGGHLDKLLGAADRALYAAKRAGRDRVAVEVPD